MKSLRWCAGRAKGLCFSDQRYASLVPAGIPHSALIPDLLWDYLSAIEQRHIELYRLLFDHGIEYLLTPAFGPDLAERGDDYVEIVAKGLERLATDAKFLDFFRDYEVRVRFYGDYRKYFAATPYAYLLDLFDELTATDAGEQPAPAVFGPVRAGC